MSDPQDVEGPKNLASSKEPLSAEQLIADIQAMADEIVKAGPGAQPYEVWLGDELWISGVPVVFEPDAHMKADALSWHTFKLAPPQTMMIAYPITGILESVDVLRFGVRPARRKTQRPEALRRVAGYRRRRA